MPKRYECVEGNHNKYWECDVVGSDFLTHWGKIGTGGNWTTKNFSDGMSANEYMRKIQEEKITKGYVYIGEVTWQNLGMPPVQTTPNPPPKKAGRGKKPKTTSDGRLIRKIDVDREEAE